MAAVEALGKARKEALEFQLAVLTKMSELATAAFGLVAAFAWNEAIKSLFALWFGPLDTAWQPLLAYALTVTLVAVLCILWIGRIVGRLKRLISRFEPSVGAGPGAPG